MRMSRTTTSNSRRYRAGLPGVAVLMVIAAAGCGGKDQPASSSVPQSAPTTPLTTASGAPSPTTDHRPVVYPAPTKGCDDVETAALDKTIGAVKHRLAHVNTATVLTSANCSLAYASFVLNVEIDVAKDGSGEVMYRGLRGVHEKSGPVTDVAGVGSGAYSYTDPQTGPHLEAWDGNLYISAGLAPLGGDNSAAPAKELPQVVASTLAKMRP